ncbi:hypothetical protein BD310DRAFT_890890 [Dichomitus squalens]|uniref:Uncharacterized protein n=1 Tax=Dichomitus squalens TaxID=114155 RepID=A0A4Q9P9M5_9APHY|nr:hypothetical protein BD310DRAFT_890890 [Dichomitus squalens]
MNSDSDFTFDYPVDATGETEAGNKRPRTEGNPDSRRSPIEQERVAQRKQPPQTSPPSTSAPTTPRVILPLPKQSNGTMALASARYDSGDFDGLPTAVGENPHKQFTRQGEPPVAPTNLAQLGIPDMQFPHAHVPTYRLLGNVDEEQIVRVRKIENPKVAIVIHGAGQDLIGASDLLIEKITKLLSDLEFPPLEGQQMSVDSAGAPATTLPSDPIRIYKALVRKPKRSNAFGQPWTWFADLGQNSERLRKWLLYQEVFPIAPTLSFSVHPLGDLIQPWTLMVLTGRDRHAVEDTPRARQEVAKEIKDYVWKDRDFTVSTAHQVELNWGLHDDPATLLKLVTDTIEVVCVTAELKTSRKEVPAYLVYVKPVTNDREEYLEWASKFVQAGAYWRGPCRLEVNKATVECKLCKDTSHCARECPLNVEGWKGTAVEDIYTTQELEARAAGTSTDAGELAGREWQQAKARRADQDPRPQKNAKKVQQTRRPKEGKGKGGDQRRR